MSLLSKELGNIHSFSHECTYTYRRLNLTWLDSCSKSGMLSHERSTEVEEKDEEEKKAMEGEEENRRPLYVLKQKWNMHDTGQCPYVALLRACAQQKDLETGCRLHFMIARKGLLERDMFLGSSLINMYAKCGSLAKAQEVFDSMPVKNVVLWNALITGYAKHGQGEQVMTLYGRMKQEGLSPDAVTFVCVLKACGSLGAIKKGQDIHTHIAKKGLLEEDVFLGSALIDMYAKCGSLSKAEEVFDNLRVKNIVSWNALITGFAQQGHGKEALNYFERMQLEDMSPDAITFVCILKACGSIGAVNKGIEIHCQIVRKGLVEKDVFLGCALVDMYCNFGLLTRAQEVFDELPIRNVASWNALLSGYTEHEHGNKAVSCYQQMQIEGVFLNAVTFLCILKSCSSIGAIDRGQEIHVQIFENGLLEKELSAASSLVDMYSKCGSITKAQKVFNNLCVRNVVLWNALIAGYAQHNCGEEVLSCFDQMQLEGVCPDGVTFLCILKACGSLGATRRGQEVHAEIVRQGLLETNVPIGNALVDMYAKCGLLARAQEVFDKLPVRETISWNGLIGGYAQNGRGGEALNYFERMQHDGVRPDAVTFVCVLKACASIRDTNKGQEIHGEIRREGWLEKDVFVGNALIDMYIKCGLLAKAQEVFDKLSIKDDFTWGALIAGYAQHGRGEEAINCFGCMQLSGVSPNANTFVCILKACGGKRALSKGQQIHAEVASRGFLEKHVFVGNAVVDMYAKCGSLTKAEEVFGSLPVRDSISWNILIAAYAQQGYAEEAFNCFDLMQLEGFYPNAITFVCVLKACGSMGATGKGQEIHADIARKGLLKRNVFLGNALIDMYAKCGLLTKAHEVFDKLPVRDFVSYNVLIAGYSQAGQAENVFHIFDEMIEEGMTPDKVTLLSLLNACSHTGLVDKGLVYFETMGKNYGIVPTSEHHVCMVDLLARAGQLDKMVAIIKRMPVHANLVMWHTVMGACRKWGNVELGRQAFEYATQLDEKDHASYVSLSNLFLDVSVDEKTIELETSRREKQWTDMTRLVHLLRNGGDTMYSHSQHECGKLDAAC